VSVVVVPIEEATLGAVVTGLDLRSIDDVAWAEVVRAFHEHAVLVFPGQHLTLGEQIAFGRRFGRFERGKDGVPTTHIRISNVLEDGTVDADPESQRRLMLSSNEGWHSDSSYHAVAAKASMLTARMVPVEGGQTEFADMRAAYDALSDTDRALVSGRNGAHSLEWSSARIGLTTGSSLKEDAPAWHPVAPVHPATGRRSLFIGRHLCRIEGMSDDDAVRLADRLVEFACQPPRVYAHRWTVGDLVVWDNRCVLHRSRPWPDTEPRWLVGSRIAGDGDDNEWAYDED
jgi:alpha-ketoglutarate-dependent taurine dioxygenase